MVMQAVMENGDTATECAVICLCYGKFFLFNWLIQYAFIIGTCCWLGVSAVRYYDSGQCFLYSSQVLAVILLYVYKISQQYFKQPSVCQCSADALHPPQCEVINAYGMPSLETLYMSGLFSYLLVSDIMFGLHGKNWFRTVCFLSIFIWVLSSPWFTNNYDMNQLLMGVLIGSVVSIPVTVFMFYLIVDIIPYAMNTSLIPQWMNLHDDIVRRSIPCFKSNNNDSLGDDEDLPEDFFRYNNFFEQQQQQQFYKDHKSIAIKKREIEIIVVSD